MSKPPKVVIPGLNRGIGVPPGYVVGRLPGTGQGPAQLLNLTQLRKVGLATSFGVTQSNSQTVSIAHSEILSLSTSVSSSLSSVVSVNTGQSTSLSQISSSLSSTNSTNVTQSTSLSQISSSLSSTNSTNVTQSTSLSQISTSLSQISSSLSSTNSTNVTQSTSLSQISSSLSGAISSTTSLSTAVSTVISGSISTVNSRIDSLSTAGGGGGTTQGPVGFGFDGEDGQDGIPIPGVPGAAGAAGAAGATGPQGPIGFGLDGQDGEDGMSVPGTPGATGGTGATGATGPQGPIGFGLDGQDGEDGMSVPGTPGVNGAAGAPGGYGTLFVDFADAGNTTTAETDLYSHTIAASQLANDGDRLVIRWAGTFVNSATATRQIRAYFGGTLFFDTGALTISVSGAEWYLEGTITRVSSSIVRCTFSMATEGATLADYTQYTSITGLTLTNTNILKVTGTAAGTGAATNDIVAKAGAIDYIPLSGSAISGATGSQGIIGFCLDGQDGEDGMPIPGPAGAAGTGGIVAPTIRASKIQSSSASSYALTWPTGTAADDIVIIMAGHGFGFNSPSGWSILNVSSGTNWNGAAWAKQMTAADITAGGVTITTSGSFNGVIAQLTFIGATGSIRQTVALRNGSGGSPRSVSTDWTPRTTDMVVAFGSNRNADAPTCDYGTQQQQINATAASGVLNTDSPASNSAITANFTYPTTTGTTGDYQVIIVVQGVS